MLGTRHQAGFHRRAHTPTVAREAQGERDRELGFGQLAKWEDIRKGRDEHGVLWAHPRPGQPVVSRIIPGSAAIVVFLTLITITQSVRVLRLAKVASAPGSG